MAVVAAFFSPMKWFFHLSTELTWCSSWGLDETSISHPVYMELIVSTDVLWWKKKKVILPEKKWDKEYDMHVIGNYKDEKSKKGYSITQHKCRNNYHLFFPT